MNGWCSQYLFIHYIGGIKNFTNLDSAYGTWDLTRSFHDKYVDILHHQTCVNKAQNNAWKCLRGSEFTKSEHNVKNIVNVMKNDIIVQYYIWQTFTSRRSQLYFVCSRAWNIFAKQIIWTIGFRQLKSVF